MEIILIKDIPGLGFKDEVVNVKNGYGRNYIIPQGLGVLANKSNSKVLEENLKQTVKKQEEILKEAQKLSKKIGNLVLDFKLKSGSDDKVFGSITTAQIAKLLSEKGIEIHKKNITILTKVNAVGEYDVELKIHKDITHPIKINVTGDVSSRKKSKKIKKEEDVTKDDNKNVKNSEESKEQDITSKENSDESQPKKSKKDKKNPK
ncbi:MAG: 50S ribosomal protein L9 [Flammeovirgaceae bacterium]|nr:50S ribosomal protein L9 [Flammeovirgaceae bacterium]|tara:strand:+ start:1510 stop:2124 length:615 start_codon:yes stop_codon:yes gene_type:complete